MTGAACRARRSDTLVAAAVLILLLAGWLHGLGVSGLHLLWTLRSQLVSAEPAQLPFAAGSLRKGAYSASSLPAAST